MSGIRIAHDAWVLIGDGEKALFFRNEGDGLYPNLQVIEVLEQDNPANRDQMADGPGKRSDGPGSHSSAMEVTDWHVLEKERFAKTIAEALYKAAHANRYSKLVLVAPPATLGTLRKELHSEVTSRVTAEIDKTLTKHSVSDIEKILTTKD